MSVWTSIRGTVDVNPLGRTQAEKRYVLETVLVHLPVVIGSEDDMNVYVVQPKGFDQSSNIDELGFRTNNLINHYGKKDRIYGSHRVQGRYILVLNGDLRDREFCDTYRQLQKWLNLKMAGMNIYFGIKVINVEVRTK